jgi:hypothetical protein
MSKLKPKIVVFVLDNTGSTCKPAEIHVIPPTVFYDDPKYFTFIFNLWLQTPNSFIVVYNTYGHMLLRFGCLGTSTSDLSLIHPPYPEEDFVNGQKDRRADYPTGVGLSEGNVGTSSDTNNPRTSERGSPADPNPSLVPPIDPPTNRESSPSIAPESRSSSVPPIWT